MYKIDNIEEIYDEYDSDGYSSEGSELLCSTAFITVDKNMELEYSDLEKMVKLNHNVDYVLLRESEDINCIHISHEYNKENIIKNGISIGSGDFGFGVYAIQKEDEIALDNLKTWIVDEFRYSESNLLVCNISYSGDYYKCISEGSNEGYLLLDENYIKLNTVDVVPINEFL